MAAPKLVIVGSSNTDLVLRLARLPGPGETLLGGDFARFAGGKGANQAVAAARAGAKVALVGARGPDDFGGAAAAGLAKEGIDIAHFRALKGQASGIALILLGGASRENMIAVARSANDALTAKAVRAARAAFRGAGAAVAQLEVPLEAVEAAAAEAAAAGIPFILNPAPARKLPAALLKRVHTLIPNEHEAALLTGQKDPAAAARKLRKAGVGNVVVTLGAKGAYILGAGGEGKVPAPKVKPVDTVGAGDCFTGWYAVGVAEGLDPAEAAARAVRAASIAVTRAGAQAGMPYRREVR